MRRASRFGSSAVVVSVFLFSAATFAAQNAQGKEPAEQPGVNLDERLVFSTAGEDLVFQPIGLIQPLFTLRTNSNEHLETFEGSGASLRRAAVGFNAQMFDVARIFVVANLASGTLWLWDYFMDLDLFEKKLVFRMGRFRPWFGRQRLVAAPKYQMVQLSKALTGLYDIGDGRDLGAGVFGQLGGRFEYGVGVWNGEWRQYALGARTSENGLSVPGNFDFQVGGRLAFHVLAPVPLGEEADLKADPTPRLTFALASMYNARHDQALALSDTESVVYEDDELQLGLEGAFKKRGFSLVAELFVRKNWLEKTENEQVQDRYEELGLQDWGLGTYVQSGVFVWDRHLELVARFDYLDHNARQAGYALFPAGGLNAYFRGYNLRAQLIYQANLPVGMSDDDPGNFDLFHTVFVMLQAGI